MTPQEAIKKLWLLRNKHECLTYQEAEKISITNAEFVDAIQMAIEALQIADRLEQADAEEMAIRIGCSKCRHTMCRRNPKYEGEQDLFEVRCDLFGRFKNDAILLP